MHASGWLGVGEWQQVSNSYKMKSATMRFSAEISKCGSALAGSATRCLHVVSDQLSCGEHSSAPWCDLHYFCVSLSSR